MLFTDTESDILKKLLLRTALTALVSKEKCFMAWTLLVIAGLFEVAWAVALKYSDGFTNFWPSAIFLFTAWVSFACLAYAIKTLPIGSSYAVWTGIGAVGIAIVGMVWFGEPVSLTRIACILLIVVGIFGLKLSGSGANVT